MAEELSKGDFEKKLAKGLALVDFYAPWCGPCKLMAPHIDELAKEMRGRARVFKVNVDKEPELGNRFNVMSIPTIMLFKDGKVVDQIIGSQSKEKLKKMIEKTLV